MPKNFTVVLSDAEAVKVRALLQSFGGSVGGFCASVIRDYIDLPPTELHVVRQQIRTLAETHRSQTPNNKGPGPGPSLEATGRTNLAA